MLFHIATICSVFIDRTILRTINAFSLLFYNDTIFQTEFDMASDNITV